MPHLVIQSPTFTPAHAAELSGLARAQGGLALGESAHRLLDVADDAHTRAAIAGYCDSHALDWAFVAPGAQLKDWQVLAMDMDSTLINIECIDEIADMAGLKQEVSAITEAAMRGEIADFSDSLRRRVALLRGLPMDEALQRVYDERLRLNPGAERLLSTAHRLGLKTLLVSGGFTWFTQRLQQRLALTEAHANTLAVDAEGRLTGQVVGAILDGAAKAEHLRAFAARHGATPARAIAIGDGANDLKMLGLAGIGVAYHAKPVVRAQTSHALNHCGLDGILNWFEDSAAMQA